MTDLCKINLISLCYKIMSEKRKYQPDLTGVVLMAVKTHKTTQYICNGERSVQFQSHHVMFCTGKRIICNLRSVTLTAITVHSTLNISPGAHLQYRHAYILSCVKAKDGATYKFPSCSRAEPEVTFPRKKIPS